MFRQIREQIIEGTFQNIDLIPGFGGFIDSIPREYDTFGKKIQFIVMNTVASVGIVILMFITPISIPIRQIGILTPKLMNSIRKRVQGVI